MIESNKKNTLPLKNISYIQHLVFVKRDQAKMQVLFDFGNKDNVITLI